MQHLHGAVSGDFVSTGQGTYSLNRSQRRSHGSCHMHSIHEPGYNVPNRHQSDCSSSLSGHSARHRWDAAQRGTCWDVTSQINVQQNFFGENRISSHAPPSVVTTSSYPSVSQGTVMSSCDSLCSHEFCLESQLEEAHQSIARLAKRLKDKEAENQKIIQFYQHQMAAYQGQYQSQQPDCESAVYVTEAEYAAQVLEYRQLENLYMQLNQRREQLEQQKIDSIVMRTREMEAEKRRKLELLSQREILTSKKRGLENEVERLRAQLEQKKRAQATRPRQRVRPPRSRRRGGRRVSRAITEAEIIQNLLQRYTEFLFSEHNLHRDKNLLAKIVGDRFGFLPVSDLLSLKPYKALATPRKHFVAAILKSDFLVLTADDWVGCPTFTLPYEKEFPFRRTVFIFGLREQNEEFVHEMLSPYGDITRVEFGDPDPNGFDRQVAAKMLEMPYVDNLTTEDNILLHHVSEDREFICTVCEKMREPIGSYCSEDREIRYCLHCSGKRAESMLTEMKEERATTENKPYGMAAFEENTFTALAVFSSQRQASKCVFVRSRIPHDGALCAHYHHYSKLKKEVALSAPYDFKDIAGNRFVDADDRPKSTPLEGQLTSVSSRSLLPMRKLVSNVSNASLDTTDPPSLITDYDSDSRISSVSPRDFEKDGCGVSFNAFCHDGEPLGTKPDFIRAVSAPVKSKQQVYVQREFH